MNKSHPKKFFVGISRKNNQINGHFVSLKPDFFDEKDKHVSKLEQPKLKKNPDKDPFIEVFNYFVKTMEVYRNFMPMTLAMARVIRNQTVEAKLENFCTNKGKKNIEYTTGDKTIYELDFKQFREIDRILFDINAVINGVQHLPNVMIIGLVASYDAFLWKLLKLVFNKHEELILNSEKQIKYSVLKELGTLDNARTVLIDREIDTLLRQSHFDQIIWMEKNLKLNFSKDSGRMSSFIEICERRNLLTHTGGVVSQNYIDKLKLAKVPNKKEIGEHLNVTPKYYNESVSTFYSFGIIIIYTTWVNLHKDSLIIANEKIVDHCVDLITKESYEIAEYILTFMSKTNNKKTREIDRRTIIINLANTYKLQGKIEEANKLIDKEDWTAVGDSFEICVNAVKDKNDIVIKLMKKIGKNSYPSADDYRSWPIFKSIREVDKFNEAFLEIFGEPLFNTVKI
jgi:hypothetical protein